MTEEVQRRMYHCPVHRLAQSALAYVHAQELVRAGDRVGVAVSGGADSVALLLLMIELRKDLGIVLSVVHLNHQLRGPESDQDEVFVSQLASRHRLELICETRDVRACSEQHKLSLEAAARQVRQGFFERTLQTGALSKIATAHTLDDQAETVLLRLVRGTGLRGLGAIRPRITVRDESGQAAGEIVRPLLGIPRAGAREYLTEVGQDWREDSTNLDLKHTRNRVRRLLLPLLEKEFNPSIATKLAEFAHIARAEEEFWAAKCGELRNHLLKNSGGSQGFRMDLRGFAGLPKPAQRRFLQSFEPYGLSLEFSHVEELISFASEDEARRELVLPSGWKVVRGQGELLFSRGNGSQSRVSQGYSYHLPVPGSVAVAEAGTQIQALICAADQAGFLRLANRKLADAGLVVRNWRPGERFWPEHSKEPRKIKELLQDRHITGESKRLWPVVASGEEIIWARGLGIRRDLLVDGDEGLLITDRPLS